MSEVANSAPDPLIGQEIFGTYKLEEILGRGGMAVVYKGRHMLTDHAVAVKVLPPDLAEQPQVKARFIEEARTLARLEHPNIVTMHNLLEDSGHLYLVMQFAEGETFDEVIERDGRVRPADVVAVGIETLKALEYAHSQGVIHRDIKPSNIIIRGDSSVKVMDFGIAKIMGSTKLTMTGQTMGTVRFMSPEQVRGKAVDHRSDLYSLGVSLYQAVAGRTPFDGDTHFEIMRMHLSDLPKPPSKFVDIPSEFDNVLLRSLEKRADARYQTAAEFRAALSRVPVDAASRKLTRSVPLPALDETGEEPSETSYPAARREPARVNRWPAVIAATLLVLAAAAVIWVVLSDDGGRSPRGKSTRASVVDATAAPRLKNQPEPHHVTRKLTLAVDKRFADLGVRVMSVKKAPPSSLANLYHRAKDAYRRYLKQEGMNIQVRIGWLNLVLVPQKVLNSSVHWPHVKPNVDYPTRYSAPTGTLYVHDGPKNRSSDLPYGFALHFCARIAQLSNARCQQLAEGFEHFFRKM